MIEYIVQEQVIAKGRDFDELDYRYRFNSFPPPKNFDLRDSFFTRYFRFNKASNFNDFALVPLSFQISQKYAVSRTYLKYTHPLF